MASVRIDVAKIVSKHVQVQNALQGNAEKVAAHARGIALQHSDSGEYAASIHVVRGKVDRYVVSDDPNAISKEFGRTGARGTGASRGVHALTRAANGEGGRD